MEVTQKDIETIITSLHDLFESELMSCNEEDLEKYWHYKHDMSLPLEISLYQFYDMLKLYHGFCRRWEEVTNGHVMVVERVRDKYLMPKIREFAKQLTSRST